jgi:hypothetical protein
MKAPRAGTPGFRAPEVLLKYKYQNTGNDICNRKGKNYSFRINKNV